jgi:hypothetical protein
MKLILILIVLITLYLPSEVMATNVTNPILPSGLTSLSGAEFFSRLIQSVITAALIIGVAIFFFTFLAGAIQWITAGGEKGGVEGARSKIFNALVGLLILFSIFAVMSALEIFFGIKLLLLDLTPLKIS